MSNLLAFPIVIPFFCAALNILVKNGIFRRVLAVVGTAATLAVSIALLTAVEASGVVVLNAGGWAAPFGIVLVADRLTALMVAISACVGFCSAIFSLGDVGSAANRAGFYTFFHILLGGVYGAFLSGDLFNIFVWFEVMLVSSFVLISSGGSKAQIGGGMKYVTLNFISSGLFLTGIGLLYGKAGTLNLADLALKLASPADRETMLPAAMLIFTAFGIKAGLFPLYSWLPASYHNPLPTVSAVFAGLLTKVGVYALIRIFTLVFPLEGTRMADLLLILSLLTMLFGVFGAATQMDARRILSFHIISQIGYMTAGLAMGGLGGLLSSIFYTIHHIAVKTNLFFVAGILEHTSGSGVIGRIGGYWKTRPLFSFLFIVPAFSLAGLPPLSGFWAKLLVLKSALSLGFAVTAVIALFVGVYTLFSMIKIWNEAFLKAPPTGDHPTRRIPLVFFIPVMLLATLTLFFSLIPQGLLSFAEAAAAQLINPTEYINAVLFLSR